VVFVTGHFGCWEVLGLSASALGLPVWTLGRMFDNVFAQRYVQQLREAAGQRMLPKEGVFRHMVRLVQNRRNVALLIDQDVRRHGIFVDFFGRPASTTPAAARIAVRTGAPVAFVYARRIPGRNRFRVVIADVVWPRRDSARSAEVKRITQRVTGDLEEVVRRWPEEWLWLHRRWETYPGKYRRRRARSAGRRADDDR
jgi:KDO2-lipid IV(A) lauroyltransferase